VLSVVSDVNCRALIVLALGAATLASAESGPAAWTRDVLFAPDRDRVVRSALIPSDERVHGQVRLIRREEATCVQTLLHSKALRRGLQRIRGKERAAWPEGQAGHADSSAFLEELRRAQAVVLPGPERAADAEETRDKRQLLIEFVLAPGGGLFALYEPEVQESEDALQITGARPLAVREASRAYVQRAMSLMLASAFHLAEPEAEALLASEPAR
jgi:hypothetical protein